MKPPNPENANAPADDQGGCEELKLFPATNSEQREIKCEIFAHLRRWLSKGDATQLRLASTKAAKLLAK